MKLHLLQEKQSGLTGDWQFKNQKSTPTPEHLVPEHDTVQGSPELHTGSGQSTVRGCPESCFALV
jgi:hypothetical protein